MLDQVLALPVRSEFERASQWASKQGRKSPVRYVMPDLWIKDDEHAKAIEVELTQKSEGRYKELWDLYGRSMPYGTSLLYLTGWPEGVDCLLKLTHKFGTQGGGWRVYVASLKGFRESAGRCLFTNNSYYEPRRLSLAHVGPVAPAAVVESALNEIAAAKARTEGPRE